MDGHAAGIIKKTIYAVVATSSPSDLPWNSPVYVVYDDELNFYWASSRESRHSRNIRRNSKVSLVIFDSGASWGTGEGVFIEARAVEVEDHLEIEKACHLRSDRIPDANQPPRDFIGDMPRRIYRASPRKIWMNHGGKVNGHFVDERIELDIAVLQKQL